MKSWGLKFDPFITFTALSLSGHLVVLGFHYATPAIPKYAVKESLSSLEIHLVDEKEPVEQIEAEKKEHEDVFVWQESNVQISEKAIPKEEKSEKLVVEEPINNVTLGAYVEASTQGHINPSPIYPRLARQRGWHGVVVLEVKVNSQGFVDQLHVFRSSGYQVLDDSAIKTIKQWSFEPAHRGTIKYAATIYLPVRFALTDQEGRKHHEKK